VIFRQKRGGASRPNHVCNFGAATGFSSISGEKQGQTGNCPNPVKEENCRMGRFAAHAVFMHKSKL
jgi:hypothetical protein